MAQRHQTTFSHSQALLLWSQIDSGMKIIRQAQALLAQRGTHLPTNSQAAHGGLLLGKVWLFHLNVRKWSFCWKLLTVVEKQNVFCNARCLILDFKVLSKRFAKNAMRERSLGDQQLQIDSIPQLLYYQPQALLHYLRKHRRNSVPYIFNFLILPNTEKILITLPVFPMEHLKNWNACHACHAKKHRGPPLHLCFCFW